MAARSLHERWRGAWRRWFLGRDVQRLLHDLGHMLKKVLVPAFELALSNPRS